MAKKSKIVREHKLIKKVQKYASIRSDLKNLIKKKTQPHKYDFSKGLK